MKITTFKSSTRTIASSLIAVTALVACQPRAEAPIATTPVPAAPVELTPVPPASVTTVTPAMPPMRTASETDTLPRSAMMDSLHTHMKAMADMSGEEMLPMVPMHREMATGALARMTTERQTMNLAGDTKWNAVADSVRQDLTAMPAMTAMSLKSMMPAHHDRMMRLMKSHRDVVGGMK